MKPREGVAIPVVAAVVTILVVVFAYAFITLGTPASTSSGISTSSTSSVTSSSSPLTTSSTYYSSQSSGSSSSSQGYAYLEAIGGCTAGGGAAPCFGGNASTAYSFGCLTQAGTQQGCTQAVNVTNPSGSFTINVRYPWSNSTSPAWSNCFWELRDSPALDLGYGYCSTTGAEAFVVGVPEGAPQMVA